MASVDQASAATSAPAPAVDASQKVKKHDFTREVKQASQNAERVRELNVSLQERQKLTAQEIGKIQERINDIVDTLNKHLQVSQSDLNFAVDEISNRFMVTVTNQDTGEVVRQVPAEAVLAVAHNIEKLKGLIFDKTL
ncbi:MAG: hypothetical protein CMQ41_14775 [Gammaproteobacteria bacterium]|nr:hypothetical protein [Gammaproteobacteria bacterium]|tara:strand:- start:163 stop:576 length:414 start_codon:yes stop_codon:yes gene_type:complete